MITIRPETDDDIPAIRRVNEAAFGHPSEADLVEALRADDALVISLVAVSEGGRGGRALSNLNQGGNPQNALRLLSFSY